MTITEKLHLIDEMNRRNSERLKGWANMVTKIIYNKYSANGVFVGEREYSPRDKADYDRVMGIIEQNPDEYELVNCEYGFAFAV
jgi:hypothetical protein